MDNEQNGATPLGDLAGSVPAGGTAAVATAEPPASQGEPTDLPDGTTGEPEPEGTPYQRWLAQLDADEELKDEHEFQQLQDRKAARKEAWQDFESRIGAQADGIRQGLEQGVRTLSALEKHLSDMGDFAPEQTPAILQAIHQVTQGTAIWQGAGTAFGVIAAALEEPELGVVFSTGFRKEVEQAQVDPRHDGIEWGKSVLKRIAANLPEDILREAARSSPALRKMRQEAIALGREQAQQARGKAEDANDRVARRQGEGPDAPPRGAAGGGGKVSFGQLAKMTPQEILKLPSEEVDEALRAGPPK